MKENFSMNWKVFPKCSDNDVEKLGHMDKGEEFLTITIKVKNITREVKIHSLPTWKQSFDCCYFLLAIIYHKTYRFPILVLKLYYRKCFD